MSPCTALDLKAALQHRYPFPEWVVESELTLENRRLDVVAFGLWGQHRVIGFEIKVDRGDWLRELAQFEKSAAWHAVVDAFYIVTPPKLVPLAELPKGWGLLEWTGTRMMTRAQPARRTPGATLPREVVARIVGRQAQRADRLQNAARSEARVELRRELEPEIRQRVEADAVRGMQKEREELQRLRRESAELLGLMGLGPHEWQHHERLLRAAGLVAEALRGANGGGDPCDILRTQLARAADTLHQQVARIAAAQETLAS